MHVLKLGLVGKGVACQADEKWVMSTLIYTSSSLQELHHSAKHIEAHTQKHTSCGQLLVGLTGNPNFMQAPIFCVSQYIYIYIYIYNYFILFYLFIYLGGGGDFFLL
jgi:hypothetical protein